MREEKILGTLLPVGGGDPVPLKKAEITIGRRKSCDIRLDFENVSGRHCFLHYTNGLWHVRDMGSTNGTRVNGQKLQRDLSVTREDEIAIASHLFTIDYEAAAPLMESQQMLEEETIKARPAASLMEMAGFSKDGGARDAARRPSRRRDEPRRDEPAEPPARPLSDDLPSDFDVPAARSVDDDDDFFKLIEEDVKKS